MFREEGYPNKDDVVLDLVGETLYDDIQSLEQLTGRDLSHQINEEAA
jgi:hypothetical protein